jgi:predicted ATPase
MHREVELGLCLWQLEDYELIYQKGIVPEEEYPFKHVLTQEALYQNIPKRRRASLHQRVAEAIEELYQDNLEEYYGQLAYHYNMAGNTEETVKYLLKSGEKGKKSYTNEAAITQIPESNRDNRAKRHGAE